MAEQVPVTIKRGDWVRIGRLGDADLRVIAVADGYAMVRRPGAMPFVEVVKRLRPIATGDEETTHG